MSKITQNQWRNGSCSDLVSLFNGFAFKSKDQQENGIRWLKIANVGIGKIKWNEESFLPINYRQEYERYLLKENDIVVAMTRPTLNNKLKIAKINSNDTSLLNQRVARIDIKNDNVKEFIYQLFRSDYIARKINEALKGTDPPNLSVTVLDDIYINIPPLAEQEKIAEILSTWDQAIDSTEKLIANAELQKKALMQQLLTGKKRLLDENGERFSGKWEKVKLGDVAQTINGLSGKTKADFGSGSPFITYMNVYSQSGIKQLDRCDYVNIDTNEKQTTLKKGDVFFTTSSETPDEVGLSSVLLIEPKINTYLNSFCFGIRFKNKNQIVPEFAQYLFRGAMARKKISILAQGSTRFNLSKNNFMQLIFQIPNLSEQQKIAEVLSTADREIELLTEKLEYLKAEKKALMQQLLTGKRRVKVA
ncbi:restriction endonuclease subunit S [Ignatzschineria larvae DSM 13226]|uniref:Restriction endonuclease subunit S n=1 Tax=Ignatzschineria larvae DSM 13226 TaxID=1111732 RepID=A0ABZ3C2N0_9GAMM|nr:restriction endonuclease subunit S [Ignatzschineria larvae]